MEGDHIKIWHGLTPLSWLYGAGVTFRNILFECGVLRSESFDIPVISVGNITAGGTGKTPHTEYLIRLLSQKHQVAILSRGYKRKSKGYRLADSDTPMREIGDEPYQMKHKFPHIHMAVDKNRRNGIHQLCNDNVQPPADVIILDDAYQHRYVQPGVNILLMDYHRLIYFDKLLPAGRLREPKSSSHRADIVIVTKCPDYITPMEQHGIARSLAMQPWQKLYYTRFVYGDLHSLHSMLPDADGDITPTLPLAQLQEGKYNVILLTGIASPQQMEYDLHKYCDFTPIHFADHHNFSRKDLAIVSNHVRQATAGNDRKTIVITTEKDATRLTDYILTHPDDPSHLCQTRGRDYYVLPVDVQFLNNQADDFNQFILGYVHKNSRNSTLSQGKNPRKA